MGSRREHALIAAVLAGGVLLAGTELASAIAAVSCRGLLAVWIGLAALAVVLWHRRPRLPPLGARGAWRAWPVFDRALTTAVAFYLLLTLLVALLAPPQNPDALAYHLPRVMHWIQNASLAHYPTHDERQLYSPPFGEIVRLHLQLATGSDRAGGLLQWIAMVLSLAAVTLVARDLGGGVRAQLWAMAIAATIPTGVLLASSGKTEWVITLWLLALAHLLFRLREDERASTALLAGAALGLALLTKITAWLCGGPFVAAYVLASLPRWRPAVARTLLVVAVATLLFAPHAWRNLRLFGNPVGDAVFATHFEARPIAPATVLSGMVRNAAVLVETPSTRANALVTFAVAEAHRRLGLDAGAPNTTSPPGGFHVGGAPGGDSAGALGLVLLLVLAVGAAVAQRAARSPGAFAYLACLAVGFVGFSGEVKWQAENGRILLPVLVLATPAIAVLLEAAPGLRRVRLALLAALPLLALPNLLAPESRPLLGPRNLFDTPRRDLLLTRCDMRDGYVRAVQAVRERGFRSIGLDFIGYVAPCEYVLWPLLAASGPPVRIEHVNVRGPSSRLAEDPPWDTFAPDGILFVRNSAEGRTRLPPAVFVHDQTYGLVRAAGAVGVYAREPPSERRARIAHLLADATARLRHRQQDDGSWETLVTTSRVFAEPQAETAPYVPWVVASTLAEIAGAACLDGAVTRARDFVHRQGKETATPPAGAPPPPLARLLEDLGTGAVTRDAAVDRLDRAVVLGAPDEQNPPVLLYYSLAADGQWRCHWSVDVGYAQWIRAYFEIARRWPKSLLPPPSCPPATG